MPGWWNGRHAGLRSQYRKVCRFKSCPGYHFSGVDMPESLKPSPSKRKWTNLEIADQMFKDAFLVKKTRFSHLHPKLSDEELHKMTVKYFRNLPDDEGKRGKL